MVILYPSALAPDNLDTVQVAILAQEVKQSNLSLTFMAR